jgi:hypothetical protein
METAADSYVGYAGLLLLAGLLPMSEAIHHGLTVERISRPAQTPALEFEAAAPHLRGPDCCNTDL